MFSSIHSWSWWCILPNNNNAWGQIQSNFAKCERRRDWPKIGRNWETSTNKIPKWNYKINSNDIVYLSWNIYDGFTKKKTCRQNGSLVIRTCAIFLFIFFFEHPLDTAVVICIVFKIAILKYMIKVCSVQQVRFAIDRKSTHIITHTNTHMGPIWRRWTFFLRFILFIAGVQFNSRLLQQI